MTYSITCECGRTVPVAAAMAGGKAICTCGTENAVPRLSQLRVAAGQGAFDASSIDVVRRLVREGQLPTGAQCEVCGSATSETLHCTVLCEQTVVTGGGSDRWWILTLLLLPLGFLYWRSGSSQPLKQHGRDVHVEVPLRICSGCRKQVAARGSAGLAAILQRTPATAQLLQDFPEAEIVPGGLGRLPSI
jgi:hypothetical protein